MPSLTSDSRRIVLQRRLPGLSAEALDWLAHHTPGSMRQLLGIIAQLASLPTTDLTPTRLANWFRDHDAPRSVDGVLDRIVARVAAEFQLDAATLTGRDRRPTVAKARQLCIYLARNWTSLSFDQLSHYFRRDESTLRHAYQQLATTRPRDETLSRSLDRIESDLLLWIN
jgi:chromosomal replication initiator protein